MGTAQSADANRISARVTLANVFRHTRSRNAAACYSLRMAPAPARRRLAVEHFSSKETVRHRGPDGNAPTASTGDEVTISSTCGGGATLRHWRSVPLGTAVPVRPATG